MHEIVFLERFKALGNHYQWIPRDVREHRPTNDFHWEEQSIDVEIKSMSSTKYKSIARRINDSVTKASEKNVVKENYIIDLGQATPPDKLLRRLALYNKVHTRKNSNLFILDSGGIYIIELIKNEAGSTPSTYVPVLRLVAWDFRLLHKISDFGGLLKWPTTLGCQPS